ncbi:MAG: lamin tail domain-containing protein [Patescibacteria group bacterium]|nr:lamin tail domain-containing protein [Patescibacteria group bacterium]
MIKNSVILIFVFLISFSITYADFEITEIMYNLEGTDTNREWIKVKNTGTNSADLSTWFFFSGNSKHSLFPEGISSIEVGDYAVIVQNVTKFKEDNPNFSGNLFDSSWTGLKNSSDVIALKDSNLNIFSEITYDSSWGGNGDGNSLQKKNGSWVGESPTLGESNEEEKQEESPTSSNSASSSSEGSLISINNSKITASVVVDDVIFVDLPFSIEGEVFGYNGSPLISGRFLWNFGDGMTKETRELKKFEYLYEYPGEYILSLMYYKNYYNVNALPDVTEKIVVEVVPAGIFISSIGTENDPYVEIENKSEYETDISGWILAKQNKSFTIPEGTFLLSERKIKLSSKITGFNFEDIKDINLFYSTGEIVPQTKEEVKKIKEEVKKKKKVVVFQKEKKEEVKDEEIIDLNTATASAGSVNKSFNPFLGLIGIIVIGSVAVYFSYKKKEKDDDFTIVE